VQHFYGKRRFNGKSAHPRLLNRLLTMLPAKSAEWNSCGAAPMPITDIPILSMLRTRMQWHQARQRILAENVANADTPDYRPRDLAPPNFERALQTASLPLATTNANHIVGGNNNGSQFADDGNARYEIRPRGNAVNHEDEMLKLAGNQMDYDAVASLYTHSLALIKTAVGKA
jgi:flagellar basal-body rod protein FlgB